MTTNPTDSSKVLLTGENSFIRLSRQNGALQTTRTSHWRVLLSPGGQGHVLFMKSDVANDEVRVYSNNIALARWLQETIESFLFPEFADQTLPVVDAVFNRSGDGRSFWTESVESDDDSIALTWHDFMEPYMLVNPAGGETNRPLVLQRRFLNLVSFWAEPASRKARPQSCQACGQVAMKRCSRSLYCEPSL